MLEPRPLRPTLLEVIVESGLDVRPFGERLAADSWHLLPASEQRERLEDVLHAAVVALGSRNFPLMAASRVQLANLSALGVVAKAAPTVGAALERILQYHMIWVRCLPMTLLRLPGRVRLELVDGSRRSPGAAYCSEFVLGSLQQELSELANERLKPSAVEFIHSAPENARELGAFFGVPVRFGARRDAIEFDADVLDMPVASASQDLTEVITDYLDNLTVQPPLKADSLVDGVETQIMRMIGKRQLATLKATAKVLALGERTLQRRLSEEALSFSEIVARVQKRRAEGLLLGSSKSVDEISAEVGFSSASAFIRAFHRWTGETPSQFRKECRETA